MVEEEEHTKKYDKARDNDKDKHKMEKELTTLRFINNVNLAYILVSSTINITRFMKS